MKFNTLYTIVKEMRDEQGLTFFHVTPTDNVPNIKLHGLIPSKGERSEQAEEDREGIFLFANINDAIDAIYNWLGDEFDEEEQLSMLRITMTRSIVKGLNIHHDGLSYVSYDIISPEYISIENIEI
jgi:hypothetical protein